MGREKDKQELGKRINIKAANLYDKIKEKYVCLMKKKSVVLADKQKIEQVISELDIKKKEAIKFAWKKVNKNFGLIFDILLPNTKAMLVEPAGFTFMEGLVVKVALGGIWKLSLSELSGGQRSLLALSLLLALLTLNPAPIYILDELDAALDLNHTKNIGKMIKTH